MEVDLDVVPPLLAVVVWMMAMVPEIESVSRMVLVEHCYHTP